MLSAFSSLFSYGCVAHFNFQFVSIQVLCSLRDPIAIGSQCSLCPFFQVTKTTKKTQRTQSRSSQVVTSETSVAYQETIQQPTQVVLFHHSFSLPSRKVMIRPTSSLFQSPILSAHFDNPIPCIDYSTFCDMRRPYFTENLYTVVCLYVSPGFKIVFGKAGWLGLSG